MAYKSLKDRVEEIRLERGKLATQIADLIENFQSSTGIMVAKIDLQHFYTDTDLISLLKPRVDVKLEL